MSNDVGPVPAAGPPMPELTVERASVVTEELESLWQHAVSSLRAHRGGAELLAADFADAESPYFLRHTITAGHLWTASTPSSVNAILVVRDGVAELVYVATGHRRQGVARRLLATVIELGLVVDAHVLPGDRATKSLFESLGWKARLLTMRDARRVDEQS